MHCSYFFVLLKFPEFTSFFHSLIVIHMDAAVESPIHVEVFEMHPSFVEHSNFVSFQNITYDRNDGLRLIKGKEVLVGIKGMFILTQPRRFFLWRIWRSCDKIQYDGITNKAAQPSHIVSGWASESQVLSQNCALSVNFTKFLSLALRQ